MPRRPQNEKPIEADAARLNGGTEQRAIGIEKGAPRHLSSVLYAGFLAGRARSERDAETVSQVGGGRELDDAAARETSLGQHQGERRRDLERVRFSFEKRAHGDGRASQGFERVASDDGADRSGVSHYLNIVSVLPGRHPSLSQRMSHPMKSFLNPCVSKRLRRRSHPNPMLLDGRQKRRWRMHLPASRSEYAEHFTDRRHPVSWSVGSHHVVHEAGKYVARTECSVAKPGRTRAPARPRPRSSESDAGH